MPNVPGGDRSYPLDQWPPCLMDGPPCWRLLEDPVLALSDPVAWPRHLCGRLCYRSVGKWWQDRAILPALPGIEFEWPLPVGRGAMHRHLAEPDGAGLLATIARASPTLGFAMIRQAPFAGDERAALIVPARIGCGVVTAFCLATEDGDGDALWGRVVFTFEGNDPGDFEVRSFVTQARRWWGSMAGAPIGRVGRPTGIRNYSRENCVERIPEACRAVVARTGRRPTQIEVAGELGVSEATLRRYLRDYRIAWPPTY